MWRLKRTQSFPKIRPSDLVFDPTYTISKLFRDFIKENIMNMLHEYPTTERAQGFSDI